MFAQLHLFLQINYRFEKSHTKNKELGSMAIQADLCAPGALLVLVHDKIRGSLVLYSQQSQAHFWRNGRRTQAGDV